MFCSKCGNKSPSGARFCQKCGAKTSNSNESASLLAHPASVAELGENPDSHAEPPLAEPEHTPPNTKRTGSSDFMSYNVVPDRSSDAKINPAINGFKRRAHMAAPTTSADMDYRFYPGQKAEPDADDAAVKDDKKMDPMDYSMQPVFPKPAVLSQRVISDASHSSYHKLPAPGLPAPNPPTADVAEFTGYQILPAAYKPVEARQLQVEKEHVSIPQAPLPVLEQISEDLHQFQPQFAPVQPVLPPPELVQMQQPQVIPPQAQQPQPVPIQVQQPQVIHPQPVQPQPAPVQAQQPQVILPQPVQPNPMPIQQPMHTQPQEPWHTYEEADEFVNMPKKKSKLPVIIIAVVLLIAAGGAAFFLINRAGNVSASQMIGTWEQSPPLGTWIPRLEFREDGTGQFYQHNGDHNVTRNEVQFTWRIEYGNMMRNSLWPALAEIQIVRGAPPRFNYRIEGSDSSQSFVMVVNP